LTVSGTLPVSADASDDVGVLGVQFKLDGANLQAEDTSPPYTISWDTTTTPNGSHSLTAVARDAAGHATTSSVINVTVLNDTTPPSVPTGLSATAISSSQIDLTWIASTDTGGSGLAGYRLERCQGAGCSTFTQIAAPATNAYTDTGLSPSTTYGYRVRAVDGVGNLSGYSSVVSGTTQATAYLQRLNAGGASYTDALGQRWSADKAVCCSVQPPTSASTRRSSTRMMRPSG
jgi:predicted phage tail protein